MVTSVLQRLIALDGDVTNLIEEARGILRENKVPSQEASASLRLADVDRALEHYARGAFSEEWIQEWAEVLEMNEHVDYERGVEDVIADVLFRLSSPEINGALNQAVVRELRANLKAAVPKGRLRE